MVVYRTGAACAVSRVQDVQRADDGGRKGRPWTRRTCNDVGWGPKGRWFKSEQAYPKLIYFNEVEEGNHFAAWQEPELFTTELRAGFRSLR
jgi:hypothetical protein